VPRRAVRCGAGVAYYIEYPMGLFRGSVVSVRLRECEPWTKAIKYLFHRYFSRLLRALEVDIVKYKIFRENSCASLHYMFL
jgi:hypothetical protein